MGEYHAIDIAKQFLLLEETDFEGLPPVSHMKLQKLVYFAQLVSLCDRDVPIHVENTHAFDYGPVAVGLYKSLRHFGRRSLTFRESDVKEAFANVSGIATDDAASKDIVKAVWDKFRTWTAVQLSQLTHRVNSPWTVTYSKDRYSVITHETMKKYKWGSGWDGTP